MVFQPGDKKIPTSGRKAGTRNKRTQQLINAAKRKFKDLDPVLGMLQLAQDELTALKNGEVVNLETLAAAIADGDKEAIREQLQKITASKDLILSALKGAAPYLHAKLKAVDINAEMAIKETPKLELILRGLGEPGGEPGGG